jgi:phenylalanyl-tRNA synthetase beta chain
VTGLLVGQSAPRNPYGTRRAVDVFDAKADAEAILSALGAPAKAMIQRNAPGWWHPGRSGQISLGPKVVLAAFGEVHPKILRAFDVKGPAVAFTVFPERIPAPKARAVARPALVLSDLQAVERDFAFVLDAGVEAVNVVNAAAGADRALIEEVRVFDEFTGGSLGEGRKSLAITVRLQPSEKTLTEAEIEAVGRKIVEKVEKATGGTLRG